LNVHKVLFAGKLALGLLLGFLVVKTVLLPGQIEMAFPPASAYGTEGIWSAAASQQPVLTLADYAQISGANPFMKAANRKSRSYQGDKSVSEQLGLVLLGTVSGGPAVARAVIKNIQTNVIDLYKTGQSIAAARIETIEKEQVMLLHDGRLKVLRLNSSYSPGSIGHKGNPENRTAKQKVKAPQTHSHQEVVSTYRTKIRTVESILKKAKIKPYVVNGRVEGLRLTGLDKIEAAAGLGLKEGDVIQVINGQKLDSKQKAYQIFMKARSQKVMNFELLRDGERKKLSFVLR